MARSSLGPGLDGILVVAKPAGPTSHDVVALVRRLAATKRVGHGGTLDPFASGVLPVFLGHATRMVEYHLGDRKAYRATVCFGASSTTDDLEGELTPAAGPRPDARRRRGGDGRADRHDLAAAAGLQRDQGRRPTCLRDGPGRARRSCSRQREVTIHALTLVSWDDTDPDRPIAVIDVACSAGTYVRALARDLGEAVGSAAYLGALTRTASGPFTLDDAIALDDDPGGRGRRPGRPRARSCARSTPAWRPSRSCALTVDEVAAVARGQFVRPAAGLPGGADHYRLAGPGRLARGDRVGDRPGGSRRTRCSSRRPAGRPPVG